MNPTFDPNKPRDVVAFGRATVDLYANGFGPLEDAATFSKYVGGSPANTSVALANLGLKVGYIGKVSDDGFGRFIVNYMSSKGIDTSHIETDTSGSRSGVTIGEFRSPSECRYFMYRKDCADLHISCSQLDEDYIASHKMLLLSGTSLSHSPAREAAFLAVEIAKRNGVHVAFDFDYRDGTWDSPEEASVYYALAARTADIVFGTREEFDVMERSYLPGNRDNELSARRLLEAGASIVSIKRGKEGSVVHVCGGEVFRGGIYPAKVENTFGAGDSYGGAFIFSLLRGKSIPEALKYAAASAAITVSGHSCSEAMPDLPRLEEYMKSHDYIVK